MVELSLNTFWCAIDTGKVVHAVYFFRDGIFEGVIQILEKPYCDDNNGCLGLCSNRFRSIN